MTARSTERRGVLVLGMHRSGTSLVSNLLGRMGCDYGGDLMPAKEDNPRGYWENQAVVDLHEEFLAAVGYRWDDARPLASGVFSGAQAQATRQALRELFERDFASTSTWVLKDPRHCRLLPLWDELIAENGDEIRSIHVLRDPVAVSESLAKRNGLAPGHAFLLWIRHYLESERATRGRRRAWLSYEALLAAPEEVWPATCLRVGLGDLPAVDFVEILDRSLDHHRSRITDDADLANDFPWLLRVVDALQRLTEGESPEAQAELDEVTRLLEISDRVYGSPMDWLSDEIREVQEKRDEALNEIRKGQDYVGRLESELEEKRVLLEQGAEYARSLEEELAAKNSAQKETEDWVELLKYQFEDRGRKLGEAKEYNRQLKEHLAEVERNQEESKSWAQSVQDQLAARVEELEKAKESLRQLEAKYDALRGTPSLP